LRGIAWGGVSIAATMRSIGSGINRKRPAAMPRLKTLSATLAKHDHHCLAHAALGCVHFAMGVLLALDGALAHSLCALVAALIYAALSRHKPGTPR
jgi:hypothetical protein